MPSEHRGIRAGCVLIEQLPQYENYTGQTDHTPGKKAEGIHTPEGLEKQQKAAESGSWLSPRPADCRSSMAEAHLFKCPHRMLHGVLSLSSSQASCLASHIPFFNTPLLVLFLLYISVFPFSKTNL